MQPIRTNQQNRKTFSTFSYKGTISPADSGTCNQWENFFQYDLTLPYDFSHYSSLSVTAGAYDFVSSTSLNTTVTCSDQTIVTNLAFSLANGIGFDQFCDSNRFQVAVCPVDGVVLCINCKKPCQPNYCHNPIFRDGIFLSPCTTCTARKSFYEVFDLSFSNEKLFPNFSSPIVLSAHRNSIEVQASINTAGIVYCVALLPSVNLTESLLVKSLSIAPVIASVPGEVKIVIGGLVPSTTYNVYCYTEDFSSSSMDILTVIGTRQTVSTLCCPQINILRAYPIIAESESDTSIFSFEVDPSFQQMLVSVNIAHTSNMTSCPYSQNNKSIGVFASPSHFIIPANSTFRDGSFIISNASSGCFEINLTLAAVNSVVNYSTISLPLSIYNHFNVPSPHLQSAIFSNDGSFIRILLDGKSDRGYFYSSRVLTVFSCGLLFSFQGSSQMNCQFNDEQTVIATFGSLSSRLVHVNSTITLLANRLKAKSCLDSGVSCSFSSSNSTTKLLPPIQPIYPTVQIAAAARSSYCDDLILDPTGSAGSGGRNWLKVQWNAYFSNISNVELSNYLNTHYRTTDSQVVVPARLLSVGSLNIELLLENVFSKASISSVKINILQLPYVASVSISGPKFATIRRESPLELSASLSLSSCSNSPIMFNKTVVVSFNWAVYQSGVNLPLIKSTSSSPKSFRLPPNVLQPLTSYAITVTAFAATKPYISSSANVQVQVLLGEVYAIINGGSNRSVSISHKRNSIVLNGSSSYDSDHTSSSSLSYSWQCKEISNDVQLYGRNCPLTLSNEPVISTNLSHYLSFNNVSIQRVLLFSLYVANSYGVSSNSSVVIYLNIQSESLNSSHQVLSLSLESSKSRYNPSDKILLTGLAVSNFHSTGRWQLFDSGMNILNATFLTASSFVLLQGSQYLYQAINAAVLTPGASYLVVLESGQAFSSIAIQLNAPPVGGIASAAPKNGTALRTLFNFQTFQWIASADNFPLYYEWSYSASDSVAKQSLQYPTVVSYTTQILGEGLLNSAYRVVCAVTATSSLGAVSEEVFTHVTVLPFNGSISHLNKVLDQELLKSFATVDINAAVGVLNAASAIANRANCSLRSNSFCNSLHRNFCSMQSNKCGTCLSGFFGPDDEGFPPIACAISATSRRLVAGSTGTAPQKSCINSCSGKGSCIFLNYFGQLTNICLADDPLCSAVCRCNTSHFGADCSLTNQNYTSLQMTRELLCSGLERAVVKQDFSMSSIQSFALSIEAAIIDFTQMTENSTSSCSYALINLMNALGTQNEVQYGDTILQIIRTLSYVIFTSSSNNLLPPFVVNDIESAILVMTGALQKQNIIGESFVGAAATRFSFLTGQISAGVNNTISVPQVTVAQNVPSKVPDSISLRSSSKAGVTLFQFDVNVLNAKTISPGLHLAVNPEIVQAKGNLVYAELQNVIEMDFFVSPNISGTVKCLKTGQMHNITIKCWKSDVITVECPGSYGILYAYSCPTHSVLPQCVVWNGTHYITHESCSLHSFNNNSVTCACELSGSAGRRLLSTATTLKVSSIVSVSGTAFSKLQLYAGPLANPSNEYDEIVTASFSTFAVLLIILFISISYFDGFKVLLPFNWKKDRMYSPYINVRINNSRFCDCYHGKYSHSKGESDPSVLHKFVEDSMSIESFFHSILPKEFTYLPSIRKFVYFLQSEHLWLCGADMRNKMKSNSLRNSVTQLHSARCLVLVFKILSFIFFDSVFVYAYFRDDGSCEAIHHQHQCLVGKTFLSISSCSWDPTLTTSCSFNQGGLANAVVIVILLAIINALTIPIEHLVIYTLVRWTVIAERPYRFVSEASVVPISSTKEVGKEDKLRHRKDKIRDKELITEKHNEDLITAERNNSLDSIIESHYGVEQHKLAAKSYELKNVLQPVGVFWRAARLRKLQLNTDLKSSRKEVSFLLNEIHANDNWKIVDFNTAPSRKIVRILSSIVQFVYEVATFKRSTSVVVQYERNLNANIVNYVTDEVKYARLRAKHARRVMKALISDHDKEVYLTQLFIVESLPTEIERKTASFLFFDHLEMALPHPLDRWIAYLLTTLLILYALLAVVYVFLFGGWIGSKASLYWLIIALACCFQDILVFSPLKILIKRLGLSSVCGEKVQALHFLLERRARFLLTRTFGVMGVHSSHLLQHFNPACRVARSFPHLPSSRLLISLNDTDLPLRVMFPLNEKASKRWWIASIIRWLPAFAVFYFPRWAHGVLLELWLAALWGGILVGLAYSASISIFVPIALSAIFVVLVGSIVVLSQEKHTTSAQVPNSRMILAEPEGESKENEVVQNTESGQQQPLQSHQEHQILVKTKVGLHNPNDDYDKGDVREFIPYKDKEKTVTWKSFLEQLEKTYATIIYASLHPPELTAEEKAAEADRRWAAIVGKLRAEVAVVVADWKITRPASAASIPPEQSKDDAEEKDFFNENESFADLKLKYKIKGKDGKPRRGWIPRSLRRKIEQSHLDRLNAAVAKEEEKNAFSFDFLEEPPPSQFTRGEEGRDNQVVEVKPSSILSLSGANIFHSPTPRKVTRPTERHLSRERRLRRDKLYHQLQLNAQRQKDDEFEINLFDAEGQKAEEEESMKKSERSESLAAPAIDMNYEVTKKSVGDEQYILVLSGMLEKLRSLPPQKNNRLQTRFRKEVSVLEQKHSEHLQKKMEDDFDFCDIVNEMNSEEVKNDGIEDEHHQQQQKQKQQQQQQQQQQQLQLMQQQRLQQQEEQQQRLQQQEEQQQQQPRPQQEQELPQQQQQLVQEHQQKQQRVRRLRDRRESRKSAHSVREKDDEEKRNNDDDFFKDFLSD